MTAFHDDAQTIVIEVAEVALTPLHQFHFAESAVIKEWRILMQIVRYTTCESSQSYTRNSIALLLNAAFAECMGRGRLNT